MLLGPWSNEARLSQDRRDGWMKVEMGKYFDENGDDNILASILLNFERSSTKHGLIIQWIELRPKIIDRLNCIFDTATLCNEYVNVRCI